MNSLKKIWWISLVVKLALAVVLPLSADEAYYWVWSQRMQLSYFDHPPMVSWLFYLGNLFADFGNAVRWPAVILGHLSLWVWYLILKDSISWDKIRILFYITLFSPLLGFGSLIVTPDLPVIFFWSLSILFGIQALKEKDLKTYAAFGVALGLGFCAKYHIVLFIPCFLAYLTIEKRWKEVRWSGVALTVVTGLLFCTPVLLWNLQNEWMSFKFQLAHGLEKSTYNPEWTISYILGQILIIFPLIFWAGLKARPEKNLRWLYYFSWGPLLFFLYTSFRALVEANWPIIAYPSFLALAIFYPRIEKWWKYHVGFWAAIITIVLATLFIPTLRNMNDKVAEPYHFQEVAEQTKDLRPLYASSYQMASSLWYFSKDPVFKLKEISRYDFFDTLPEATPSSDHFYLVKRDTNGIPSWISEEQWQMKEIRRISPNFIVLEFKRP